MWPGARAPDPADVAAVLARIQAGHTPLIGASSPPVILVVIGAGLSAKRAEVLANACRSHGCSVLGPVRAVDPGAVAECSHVLAGTVPGALAKPVHAASLVQEALIKLGDGDWSRAQLDQIGRQHRLEPAVRPQPQPEPAPPDSRPADEQALMDAQGRAVHYPLDPHPGNLSLVGALTQLLKYERAVSGLEGQALSQHRPGVSRELTIARGLAAVRRYPDKLSSAEQLAHLPYCGTSFVKIVEQWLESGELENIVRAESHRPMVSTMMRQGAERPGSELAARVAELTHLPGVGPKTAAQLIAAGVQSIAELIAKRAQFPKWEESLRVWQARVEVSRHQAEQVMDSLQQLLAGELARRLDLTGSGWELELAGGLRRGKPSGHDIDILATHQDLLPGSRVAAVLQTALVEAGLAERQPAVTETHRPTTDDTELLRVLWRVGEGKLVGVDIVLHLRRHKPFVQLGWTGSKQYEKFLRCSLAVLAVSGWQGVQQALPAAQAVQQVFHQRADRRGVRA